MVAELSSMPADLGLECTAPLAAPDLYEVGVRMAMDGFKWDLQVGEVPVLAPFVLTLPQRSWAYLSHLATQLSRELMMVESKLALAPALWSELGLPPKVRRALERELPWTPSAGRIVRYDFHVCREGLKISEVNSDVPGGLNEAATFARLMQEFWPNLNLAGDPLVALATALADAAAGHPVIALISAAGYLEDLQVVSGVAAALAARGLVPIRIQPQQIRWNQGRAEFRSAGGATSIGAIYRFFQGEWTERLSGTAWGPLFRGGSTPVCNPGISVLTESKRLPLVWPRLECAMPTWEALLPISADPRGPAFARGRDWVFKSAYCNTGDSVVCREWSSPGMVAMACLAAALRPRHWIAQRRFDPLWIETPLGLMSPCLGVYTVDGVAVGIYGRLCAQGIVDYSARDVAVLIRD